MCFLLAPTPHLLVRSVTVTITSRSSFLTSLRARAQRCGVVAPAPGHRAQGGHGPRGTEAGEQETGEPLSAGLRRRGRPSARSLCPPQALPVACVTSQGLSLQLRQGPAGQGPEEHSEPRITEAQSGRLVEVERSVSGGLWWAWGPGGQWPGHC